MYPKLILPTMLLIPMTEIRKLVSLASLPICCARSCAIVFLLSYSEVKYSTNIKVLKVPHFTTQVPFPRGTYHRVRVRDSEADARQKVGGHKNDEARVVKQLGDAVSPLHFRADEARRRCGVIFVTRCRRCIRRRHDFVLLLPDGGPGCEFNSFPKVTPQNLPERREYSITGTFPVLSETTLFSLFSHIQG